MLNQALSLLQSFLHWKRDFQEIGHLGKNPWAEFS